MLVANSTREGNLICNSHCRVSLTCELLKGVSNVSQALYYFAAAKNLGYILGPDSVNYVGEKFSCFYKRVLRIFLILGHHKHDFKKEIEIPEVLLSPIIAKTFIALK